MGKRKTHQRVDQKPLRQLFRSKKKATPQIRSELTETNPKTQQIGTLKIPKKKLSPNRTPQIHCQT